MLCNDTPDLYRKVRRKPRGRVSSLLSDGVQRWPSARWLQHRHARQAVRPVVALTVGGLMPVAYAACHWIWGRRAREYEVPRAAS